MRSPSISTSQIAVDAVGRIDDPPPLSSLFMFRSAGQQVQDRHAHATPLATWSRITE
jgi:hypothetical protein